MYKSNKYEQETPDIILKNIMGLLSDEIWHTVNVYIDNFASLAKSCLFVIVLNLICDRIIHSVHKLQ